MSTIKVEETTTHPKRLLPATRRGEIYSRGWGGEEWIVNDKDANYCGKVLRFKEGMCCSWHYHKDKHETFYVLEGRLLVYLSWTDDILQAEKRILDQGDCLTIPPELRHRMVGVAKEDSVLLEFSTHHREDDSYRVEKGD
jgi:mannose-6-phosphate isomerase-like protein (cupin superfamily)